MLFRKKIILGVTASIAAYKSALLARLLVKAGAEVKVVMTHSAQEFITPLTLSTLSRNPVHCEFTTGSQGEWVNHVELGLWADAILVAPTSANTLANSANGICNNLLQAVYLSARCPVFFAPAMDVDMWHHPSTQNNINRLEQYGNHILHPQSGELASGLVGEGRMLEPEDIVKKIEHFFAIEKQMKHLNVLITAGPTQEKIDDVRYISNHSSGKMGYAIADELANRGAKVTIVSGPVNIKPSNTSIQVVNVLSAAQMKEEVKARFSDCNVALLVAAVADYKPSQSVTGKIKKTASNLQLDLVQTDDILAEIASNKKSNQIVGGFALEMENAKENAQTKLTNKKLDFIVLNELSNENDVFGNEYNKISILNKKLQWESFEKKSKYEVASDIADFINNIVKNV
jgi:phosphopantothenoylcysteine decarboxylase/phosphopantothenate--cysteine ligase